MVIFALIKQGLLISHLIYIFKRTKNSTQFLQQRYLDWIELENDSNFATTMLLLNWTDKDSTICYITNAVYSLQNKSKTEMIYKV